MRKLHFILVLVSLCVWQYLPAQLQLENQSIPSSTVYSAVAGFTIESSIGQLCTSQWQSSNHISTEGFHQPTNVSPLVVDLKVMINDCDHTFTVDILSIVGCGASATFTIMWNGIAADLKTTSLPEFSTLRITSSDGCVLEQSYFLNTMNPQIAPCDLIPYNFVTPNGDGQNEYFHIEHIDRDIYKGASVSIFNRWGNVVWVGKNYDNEITKWTGKNSEGKLLPAGTYFFTIEVLGTTQSGYVELMQ